MTTKELDKILSTPDKELRDDDHLNREDIDEKTATAAVKQLKERYKDIKPANKKSNELALASIAALNKL